MIQIDSGTPAELITVVISTIETPLPPAGRVWHRFCKRNSSLVWHPGGGGTMSSLKRVRKFQGSRTGRPRSARPAMNPVRSRPPQLPEARR